MQKVKPFAVFPCAARKWAVFIFVMAAACRLQAQSDPDVPDNDRSSYHQALLNYKGGKYDAARVFIDEAEKAQPNSIPVEMLKVRILTEQHDFKGAKQVLENLNGDNGLTAADGIAISVAWGDLALRQHDFNSASKFYESVLAQKPGDPDMTLRLVYARIGAGDLVEAGKLSSELKPLDPANPAYYFAHAALSKATGHGDEDQDIEQARTIYGITLTNLYLKTYLEVFAADKNSVSSALNPPAPTTNASPSAP
jgi:predicted Zn-dependent protease